MGKAAIVIVIFCILGLGIYFSKTENNTLVKPIPKVFGSNTSTMSNGWFPSDGDLREGKGGLVLGANAALLVNFDTGQILYSKNYKKRLPVASTIKIMTALLVLENHDSKDIFTVSGKAAKIGEDSMGLVEGEKLSVEELLYGLMLPSGNDAAITIAEGVAGTEDAFVSLMNKTAKGLGMNDTKFINASGLDEDGRNQYSTTYDMAILAHYVWEKYPLFRKVVSTDHIFIEANNDHNSYDLYNQTNLLTTYPGVQGIKPGFTWEAGLCLVTYAENNNVRLLGVILGSSDRRGEMKELLDFGFSQHGITVDHPALDLQ